VGGPGEEASEEASFRRPLGGGSVWVHEDPHSPGSYELVVRLRGRLHLPPISHNGPRFVARVPVREQAATRQLYLLIRRMSPDTAPDVLLGVFPTPEQAEGVKATYVTRYAADPSSDPWRDQGYKGPGLSPHDLALRGLPGEPGWADVFVVSTYSEGFGQV